MVDWKESRRVRAAGSKTYQSASLYCLHCPYKELIKNVI